MIDPIPTHIMNTDPQPRDRWFSTFSIKSRELVLFLPLEDLDNCWTVPSRTNFFVD